MRKQSSTAHSAPSAANRLTSQATGQGHRHRTKFIYVYDDENRLVTVATPGASSGGGDLDIVSGSPAPDLPAPPPSTGGWRTDFVYDGFGRLRVRQDAYSYTNGWYATNTTEYIYDGSRVIQERDGNNNPTVSYTLGRDLSGTLEGAGGIGGLLARSHGYSGGSWSSHNFYHADGGGNITCMINGSQAVVASYRYDPFGNLVSSSGALAGDNLRRFSSKEFHANSGMYIYLYRFYDPRLQRWVNRDPIAEHGGLNLYCFVENDAPSLIDPLGLCTKEQIAGQKQALLAKYKQGAEILDKKNLPKRGEGSYSCDCVNNAIMNFICSVETKCWDCREERRSRLSYGFPHKEWKDHWVIICTSKAGDSMAFDYWERESPGFNPNKFYTAYPIPGAPSFDNPNEVVHVPHPDPHALDWFKPRPPRPAQDINLPWF